MKNMTKRALAGVMTAAMVVSMNLVPAMAEETTEEAAEEAVLDTEEESAEDAYEQDVTLCNGDEAFVICYGDDGDAKAQEAAELIEKIYDDMIGENGEFAKINENGGGELSEEANEIIMRAFYAYKLTDGAFDITVGQIYDKWGLGTDSPVIPTDEELEELLAVTGMSHVKYSEGGISFDEEGVQIEADAVIAAYAGDKAEQLLRENDPDVTAVIGINGDVWCIGDRDWNVGIQEPSVEDAYVATIAMNDQKVASYGANYNSVIIDGTACPDVINPYTGSPQESDIVSVSIIGPDMAINKALAMSMFLFGLEDSKWMQEYSPYPFEYVILDNEQKIYVSEGLAGLVASDFEGEVVEKENSTEASEEYTEILEGFGVDDIEFEYSDCTAYTCVIPTGDLALEIISVGGDSSDVVKYMTDTLYYDLTKLSDDDIELVKEQAASLAASVMPLDYAMVLCGVEGNFYVIRLFYWEMDDPEHLNELVSLGVLTINGSTDYLGATNTAEALTESGWTLR